MAMKLLKARELSGARGFRFVVHLDDSRLIDGSPDPAWCMTFTWGADRPAGMTKAAYLASVRDEIRALALVELAKRQAADEQDGTAIPSLEGATL